MLVNYYEVVMSTQERLGIQLPDDAEWYVVNMLATRTDLEQFPLTAYANMSIVDDPVEDIQRLGDSGLIMPSIFPARCDKLNIDRDWYYFVSMECFSALYRRLSCEVYGEMVDNFNSVKIILNNMLTNR